MSADTDLFQVDFAKLRRITQKTESRTRVLGLFLKVIFGQIECESKERK
jgi:hypothetical protein